MEEDMPYASISTSAILQLINGMASHSRENEPPCCGLKLGVYSLSQS